MLADVFGDLRRLCGKARRDLRVIETSASLLNRLRTDPSLHDWEILYELYQPFLYAWARKTGLQHVDAEDVVQDVFGELRGALPKFEYDRTKCKFRTWLRVVFCRKVGKFRRSKPNRERGMGGDDGITLMEQLEDANSKMSEIWEREHDKHVLRQLLTLIQPEFSEQAWQAFQLRVYESLPGEVVAQKLGIKRGAVDVHKSRIVKRLREVAEGLIDTE